MYTHKNDIITVVEQYRINASNVPIYIIAYLRLEI